MTDFYPHDSGVKTLTPSDFSNGKLNNKKWTLVEVYNSGCSACQNSREEYIVAAYFIEEMSKCTKPQCHKARKVQIAAVSTDGDISRNNLERYIPGVRFIPAFVLFNDKGIEVDRYDGERKAENIVLWIFDRMLKY